MPLKLRVVRDRSRLMIEGRSNLHAIKASTSKLDGWLELELLPDGALDASKPVTGRLEAEVESLKSGIDIYDMELRRRLDVRRYPMIIVELLAVREVHPVRQYQLTGSVTFHGTTRRAEGSLAVTKLDERTVEAVGEQTFDVRDFGLTPPKVLMFAVNPAVKVKLQLVAERAD